MIEKTKEQLKANRDIKTITELMAHYGGGLTIGNTHMVGGGSLPSIQRKVEKINKRTRDRLSAGMVSEDNTEIGYEELKPSNSSLKSLVDQVRDNTESFKGKVRLGEIPLFDDKGVLNGDLMYVLKAIKDLYDDGNERLLDMRLGILKFNDYKVDDVNDWKVIGVIKSSTGSFAVHSLSEDEIPDKYYQMDHDDCKDCDHCQKRRDRNDVYILKNKNDSTVMQVGGSCIDVFVEKDQLKKMLEISDFIRVNVSGTYHRMEDTLSKIEYMAHVIRSIKDTDGYIGKEKRDIDLIESEIGTSERALYAISTYAYSDYLGSLDRELQSIKNRDLIWSILNSKKAKVDIKPTEDDYLKAEEVLDYYKENRLSLIKELKRDGFYELNVNAINSASSKSLFFDGIRATSYLAIAANNYIKEEVKNKAERERAERLSGEMNDRVKLDALTPYLFDQEKVKFTTPLKVLMVKEKQGYSGGYNPEPICIYVITGVTPDGSIIKASTSALDKFSDGYRDDRGYLLDDGDLTQKIKGKYIDLSGSVKRNVSFQGDNGMVEYTDIRMNSISEPLDEKISSDIVIGGKINVFSLEVVEHQKGYLDIKDNPIEMERYKFKDKDGNVFLMDSDEDLELSVGDSYNIGTRKRGEKDGVVFLQKPKKSIVGLNIGELKDVDDKEYTIKQAEKLCNPPQKKPKIKKP